MKKFKSQFGFTLMELMATLAVGGILATVGLPSLSGFIKNNALTANVNDFHGSLNFARSEAIKRGSRVTMCISNSTFTACNNDGDWQDGWLIFADPTNTGVVADGTLLRIHHGFEGHGASLVGNNIPTDNVSYLGTGSGALPRTFILCDDRQFSEGGKYARAIVINNTGRVMTIAGDDSRVPDTVTACTFG